MRVAFKGLWTNGRPVVNVLHVKISHGGITGSRESDMQAWLTRSAKDWQTNMLPQLINNYTFTGIDWLDLNSAEGAAGTESAPSTGVNTGGNAQPAAPPNVTVLVHKNLNTRSRGRRNGRWYLPAVAEGTIDEDGGVPPATQTTMNAAWAALHTKLNTDLDANTSNTVDVGIVSHPIKSALPAAFLTIASFITDPVVATQRRRITQR
jgi:hypothetical protein